jgi:hypothetical protein
MVSTLWPAARDFSEAIQNPSVSFVDPELKDATPVNDRLGMPLVTTGQFAYVFKLKGQDGAPMAVRCFRGFLKDREQRYQAIDDHLDRTSIHGFVSFEYDPEGITVLGRRFPILKMGWMDGLPLDVYLSNVFQRADVLKALADRWLRTAGFLRTGRVAHGDLQHGNIIIHHDDIHLVDLDGMFVPAMKGWSASELGHQHYQHPARTAHHFSASLDNFSAFVIYISFLAIAECPEIWTKFHDENLIFTKKDFQSPGASPLFAKLRQLKTVQQFIGILEKACSQDPLDCPDLLDLVKPSSQLPRWMRPRIEVEIKTLTREAQAQAKPQSPVHLSSQPLESPPQSALSAPASIPGQQLNSNQKSRGVAEKTLRNALNYAFINIWWGWFWFPFLRSIFHAFGATLEGAGYLCIVTFLVVCTWLGHRRTVAFGTPGPVTQPRMPPTFPPSPPMVRVITPPPVMVAQPMYRMPVNIRKSPWLATNLIGNRVTLVFHRSGCEWGKKISGRNRRTFSSSFDARANGYRRCRVCNP